MGVYLHTTATLYCTILEDATTQVGFPVRRQFAASYNNHQNNGIALSKNAHWLFDNGLWSLRDDYTVLVADRHFAEAGDATSDLAARAARVALQRAGVLPEQVDLIIVATITPDMPFPSTSCFIQEKLGAVNAYAMDLAAACTGFIASMVEEFRKRGVLIRAYYYTALVEQEGKRGAEGERTFLLRLADPQGGRRIWAPTLKEARTFPEIGDLVGFRVVRIASDLPVEIAVIGYIAVGLAPAYVPGRGWRIAASYTPPDLKPELHM